MKRFKRGMKVKYFFALRLMEKIKIDEEFQQKIEKFAALKKSEWKILKVESQMGAY